MSEEHLGPEKEPAPAFVEPFRYALNRMQEREILSREQHIARAKQLLLDRFGATGNDIGKGFSYGVVGIQANHTHYFNGFALMKPMHVGTAVASRKTPSSGVRAAIEGEEKLVEVAFDAPRHTGESLVKAVVASVLSSLHQPEEGGLELAIVTSLPPGLESAYLSSLAVAVRRSVEASYSVTSDEKTLIREISAGLEEIIQAKFSTAFVIGAMVDNPDEFLLVDTETLGNLPVISPGKDHPDWALVSTSEQIRPRDRSSRIQTYQEIVSRLRQKRFPDLNSLRDLEHRHLDLASSELPRRLRPALRFLVSENRRVQRMVVAIRKQDWQLMGALLFMSHASRKNDWVGTSALQDFVVDSAERFSLEGVYGAAWTGEGSFVLVAGQPFRLPAFLDQLRNNWPDQAAGRPDSLIL